MNFSAYTTLLGKTIGWYGALLIIATPIFLSEEIAYLRAKRLSRKKARDMQQASDVSIVVFILLLILFVVKAFPIAQDIVGRHYVEVHGVYSMGTGASDKSGIRPTKWVEFVTDDGIKLILDYPKGMDRENLPTDAAYGTVWYAENSKIILEFIPDEDVGD